MEVHRSVLIGLHPGDPSEFFSLSTVPALEPHSNARLVSSVVGSRARARAMAAEMVE